MSGKQTPYYEDVWDDPPTEASGLNLESLDQVNQLLSMDFSVTFFRTAHIFNVLQEAMYILSARLDTDSVGPANFKVAYGSSVALANIQEPVEDVIVILGIDNDFVCAVEYGCGFGVYEAAGAEKGCVCWVGSGGVTTIYEALLK